MYKLLTVSIAIATFVGFTCTSGLLARTQRAAQIEYLRVTPYAVHVPTSSTSVLERFGYRACVAGVSEWTCRDFPPNDSSTAALRSALSTLGNEGWDLISAVNESSTVDASRGVTYLFKRQVSQ